MIKKNNQITGIADDRESKNQVIKFLSDMKNASVAGIGESIAESIKCAVKEQIQPYGVIDEFPI